MTDKLMNLGNNSRKWLLSPLGMIIAVSVLLRLAAAVYLGEQVVDLPGTFDQLSYTMLAQQVLAGHGFTVAENWWPLTPAGAPTAHWSYLYTLYLVAVYGVVGYHPLAARVVQAVLVGVLMPWLVYRLGRRHFNPNIGLLAAALLAVYAYFIYYAATLMTEPFYITAILWQLDLAGRLGVGDLADSPPGSRLDWLWLGLALGITVLLRQLFLLVAPFLFLWILGRRYRWGLKTVGDTIVGLAFAGCMLIAMIAPWTYRNYQAFHTVVLLNTNAGFAFFWGNHPIHGYNFIDILPPDGPSYQDLIPPDLRSLNEAQLDQALLKEGFKIILADPLRYVILSASRLKDYFRFLPSAESGIISNLSRVFSFGILWPFMLYGLVLALRKFEWGQLSLLYLFVILYTGIHLLSWALIRYRLPVDAVLLPFAALALSEIWSALKRQRNKGK